MNEKRKLLTVVLACTLIFVGMALPVNAKLPPRPDVTPVAEDYPAGTIILDVSPAQTGLWSVVQWQDAGGGWHDVDGWRGEVQNGRTIWWVEKPHWGTGPFRWVVLASANGAMLGTSISFNLPQSGQAMIISVDLSSQ